VSNKNFKLETIFSLKKTILNQPVEAADWEAVALVGVPLPKVNVAAAVVVVAAVGPGGSVAVGIAEGPAHADEWQRPLLLGCNTEAALDNKLHQVPPAWRPTAIAVPAGTAAAASATESGAS